METSHVSHRSGERIKAEGLTLIETMVTLLILTILAVGLLQFGTHALQLTGRNEARWQQIVGLWNQARALRLSRPPGSDLVQPFPRSRPLHRFLIKNPEGRTWEVLCADK